MKKEDLQKTQLNLVDESIEFLVLSQLGSLDSLPWYLPCCEQLAIFSQKSVKGCQSGDYMGVGGWVCDLNI